MTKSRQWSSTLVVVVKVRNFAIFFFLESQDFFTSMSATLICCLGMITWSLIMVFQARSSKSDMVFFLFGLGVLWIYWCFFRSIKSALGWNIWSFFGFILGWINIWINLYYWAKVFISTYFNLLGIWIMWTEWVWVLSNLQIWSASMI